MPLFYGTISFSTKVPQPGRDLIVACLDGFHNRLSSLPAQGEPVLLLHHSDGTDELRLLYAVSPTEHAFVGLSGDEAAEVLMAWVTAQQDELSDFVADFNISGLSEQNFFAQVCALFLKGEPSEKVELQQMFHAFLDDHREEVSASSLRMLDVIFAYQPPDPDAKPPSKQSNALRQSADSGQDLDDDTDDDTDDEGDEDDGDDDSLLRKLEDMPGLAEFKDYMRELESMRSYLSQWARRDDFPNQHLLFSVDPGNGCSRAIDLLHEYLGHHGLYGTTSHGFFDKAEHTFEYPPDDPMQKQQLTEGLTNFASAIDSLAPGVMAIHLKSWLSKLESQAFADFLDCCRLNRHRVVFVFVVPYLEEGVLARVRSRLNDVLTVRLIRFHPFTTAELTRMARQYLSGFGIGWEDSADLPFQRLLAEERGDNLFYGSRTVHKLCDELLLMKASNVCLKDIGSPPNVLTADDFKAALPHDDAKDGFARLDALIGLTEVKKRVRELVVSIKEEREYYENKQGAPAPCLHMLFTGSPGTGKTTVARIIGQIFREAGLLRAGDLIEVNRFDLVGEYIGSTGPKTVECCRSAMGSILFIDEAYLLYPSSDPNDRDHGKEAIGALVAEMENNRDRFMVIMAGYEQEMERMIGANPGMRGRIPHVLHFPNYSREELLDIFRSHLREFDYEEELVTQAGSFFQDLGEEFVESREFGNARFVRNLIERLRIKALLRLQGTPKTPGEKICLTALDLESALADEDMKTINRKEKKLRIGFGG